MGNIGERFMIQLIIMILFLLLNILISLLFFINSSPLIFRYKFVGSMAYFDKECFDRNHITNESIYLLSNDYYRARLSNIEFLADYSNKPRKSSFSIIISTYERVECLKRSFYKILKYRPKNTEIVICDDGTKAQSKVDFLNQIAQKFYSNEVYIIKHKKTSGAFHTKLDAFLFCCGDYIMSLDDDDDFDNTFYQEIASNIDYCNDFIIPVNHKIFYWVNLPFTYLSEFIGKYHNHVTFAFRRALLEDINYPNYDVSIVRDDCVLMVPIYIKTGMKNIKYFNNKGQYLLDDYCKTTHEDVKKSDMNSVKNGYDFLVSFAQRVNRNDTIKMIKKSYQEDGSF
ncbi:hypothetical protein TRFO_11691 [Tritrichomonas foetus]|uniref:Glycosyltransferase 2-like domain-containing protein n=1 Tax=Tritrichomonas foetus TaxID=1144522 RepID=A0A1J4J7P1_9EUKA|nr:hypothetical protein TRFO_11691 [Tritrichomonas foetus]|eukprot:OHS93675.1 hypothetical protein TRFO_11691 [Tritrichomonas foetus]